MCKRLVTVSKCEKEIGSINRGSVQKRLTEVEIDAIQRRREEMSKTVKGSESWVCLETPQDFLWDKG